MALHVHQPFRIVYVAVRAHPKRALSAHNIEGKFVAHIYKAAITALTKPSRLVKPTMFFAATALLEVCAGAPDDVDDEPPVPDGREMI